MLLLDSQESEKGDTTGRSCSTRRMVILQVEGALKRNMWHYK